MDKIQIEVAPHGAELRALCRGNQSYMWNADKAYWGRVAPILFPVVGLPAEQKLRIGGRSFEMHQHGFARDVDFVKAGDAWVYEQKEPRENYPYTFVLEARYPVTEKSVICSWKVRNTSPVVMHFSIGAHPAFMMPDYHQSDSVHGYLRCFDHQGNPMIPVSYSYLEGGLRVASAPTVVPNEDGLIVLTEETFAGDAFLLKQSKVASVALLDKDRKEVLRVNCPQAQAYGLWNPHKPGCPFVCIEPWCGIADRAGFTGDISERDCNHSLAPGETFEFAYEIELP